MSSAARPGSARGAGLRKWSDGDDLNWELEKLQQGATSHCLELALHQCVCVWPEDTCTSDDSWRPIYVHNLSVPSRHGRQGGQSLLKAVNETNSLFFPDHYTPTLGNALNLLIY